MAVGRGCCGRPGRRSSGLVGDRQAAGKSGAALYNITGPTMQPTTAAAAAAATTTTTKEKLRFINTYSSARAFGTRRVKIILQSPGLESVGRKYRDEPRTVSCYVRLARRRRAAP